MPQPSTTPFALPGTQASVWVPNKTRAVVSVEGFFTVQGGEPYGVGTLAIANCAAGAAAYSILVDGQPTTVIARPGSTAIPQWIAWTPTLGPGTYTLAIGLTCTASSPSDSYSVTYGGPLRFERIRVP